MDRPGGEHRRDGEGPHADRALRREEGQRDEEKGREVEQVSLLDARFEHGGLVGALDRDVRGQDHDRGGEERRECRKLPAVRTAHAGDHHRDADHDRQHAEADDERPPTPQRLVEHRPRGAERVRDLAQAGAGDDESENEEHDRSGRERDSLASRRPRETHAPAAEAGVLNRERAEHDCRDHDQLVTDERNDEREDDGDPDAPRRRAGEHPGGHVERRRRCDVRDRLLHHHRRVDEERRQHRPDGGEQRVGARDQRACERVGREDRGGHRKGVEGLHGAVGRVEVVDPPERRDQPGKEPGAPVLHATASRGPGLGDRAGDLGVLDLVREEPCRRVLGGLPDVQRGHDEEREEQRPEREDPVEACLGACRRDARHETTTALRRRRQMRNSLRPTRSASRPTVMSTKQITASTTKILAGNSRSVCVLVTNR